MEGKKMSKSIGKVFGSGKVGMYGSEKEYLNYLKNYDTSNYDNSLKNMTAQAYGLSQQLGNRPDYIYSVDGSDAARQRMENATYQSALQNIMPVYEQRRSDLNTRLQNQGLSVGSEAYQRAMTDLENSQNAAINQAAYQSISAGQNAFNNSLQNAVTSAEFTNSARSYPIQEIISLLSLSPSGYQVQKDLFDAANGVHNRQEQAVQSGWDNMLKSAALLVSSSKNKKGEK